MFTRVFSGSSRFKAVEWHSQVVLIKINVFLKFWKMKENRLCDKKVSGTFGHVKGIKLSGIELLILNRFLRDLLVHCKYKHN